MGVFTFIEGWCNPHRRHSGLEYLSPIDIRPRMLGLGTEMRAGLREGDFEPPARHEPAQDRHRIGVPIGA